MSRRISLQWLASCVLVIGFLAFACSNVVAVAQQPSRPDVRTILVSERALIVGICDAERFVFAETSSAPLDTEVVLRWFEFSVEAQSIGGGQRRFLWEETEPLEWWSGGNRMLTCDASHKLIGIRSESRFRLKSYAGDLIAEVFADAQVDIGIDDSTQRFWLFKIENEPRSQAFSRDEVSNLWVIPLDVSTINDGNGATVWFTKGLTKARSGEWVYEYFAGSTGGVYVIRRRIEADHIAEITHLDVDDNKLFARFSKWKTAEFVRQDGSSLACTPDRFAPSATLELKSMDPSATTSCEVAAGRACCMEYRTHRIVSPKAGKDHWLSMEKKPTSRSACLVIRSKDLTGLEDCVSDAPPQLPPKGHDWALIEKDYNFGWHLFLVQLVPPSVP